jgi:hypothetical protein
MKKIITLIVLLFGFSITFSQNSVKAADDFGRIALNLYVPDDALSEFPAARKMLEGRLKAMASRNGMGGNEAFPRFIISGDAYTTFDETTFVGIQEKYVKEVEVMVSIGDGIEGVEFASETFVVQGVDDSEDKAFISAIKALSPRNKLVKQLIETAKDKIIAYYNAKCDFILKEAETQSANKDYDNALATLIEVPEVCKECFEKAMDFSKEVFKSKMENDCQLKISEANSLIAQDQWDNASNALIGITPDMACFDEVASIQKKITDHRCNVSIGKARGAWAKRDTKNASIYLSEVSWDSACYPEAKVLFKEISSAVDAKAKAEWDLAYEKYNRDQVMKEQVHELELELARSDQEIKFTDAEADRGIRVNESNSRIADATADRGIRVRESNSRIADAAADRGIRVADAEADRGIRVANAETQRKIDMLDADAKAYLVKKTADNQRLLIKTMGKTAVGVAKANAKKQPPTYNSYTVNRN